MKNKIVILLLVIAVLLIFTGCSFSKETSAEEPETQRIVVDIGDKITSPNSLTVSATGSIEAMPDVAYITIGVTTQNEDVLKAQTDNAELMNAVFTALQTAGLSEDDMKTTTYNAYPIYDYSDDNKEITGYEVTNMAELTIADIDKVGEYIDIAAESGANLARSIQFSLTDETDYYNNALTDAMAKAKAKADTIAAAGGYTIVGTLQVTESGISGIPNYMVAVRDETADASGSTPITADELEVSASVTIVYEIE